MRAEREDLAIRDEDAVVLKQLGPELHAGAAVTKWRFYG